MPPVMDLRDKLVQLIRIKGPVIPSQVNKEVNLNLLFASAALSELVSKNVLKISSLKIGGTPLYFLPGQEARLQQFADKLNEKDKRAYDLLRQQRILRDKDQTPLVRVALRGIKDFAKPLTVNIDGNEEIFWKWYLLTNEEANSLITGSLKVPEHKPLQEKVREQKAEQRIEEREPIASHLAIEEQPKIIGGQKPDTQKKLVRVKEKEGKKEDRLDKFLDVLLDYFNKNRIEVLEQKRIRKNSEIDFLVRVPSSVGMLNYYCKAKNKKRVNEGDLSSAYLQGQAKKLPVLFLTSGETTKRAKEMLDVEFRGMSVKGI